MNEVLLKAVQAEAIKADFAQTLILLTHVEEWRNQGFLFLEQVFPYIFFDALHVICHKINLVDYWMNFLVLIGSNHYSCLEKLGELEKL